MGRQEFLKVLKKASDKEWRLMSYNIDWLIKFHLGSKEYELSDFYSKLLNALNFIEIPKSKRISERLLRALEQKGEEK